MQQPRPQLRRPLGTYTREEKHPSSGGNPYSQDMREKVIARHQLGLPIVTPETRVNGASSTVPISFSVDVPAVHQAI
jgi:hypothetical protein